LSDRLFGSHENYKTPTKRQTPGPHDPTATSTIVSLLTFDLNRRLQVHFGELIVLPLNLSEITHHSFALGTQRCVGACL
jgi:hypothetical protein